MNKCGWTFEQAIGIAPRPGYERGEVGVCYLVTHAATGKGYLGITLGYADDRWDDHIDKAMFGKRRLPPDGLHAAIRQFGSSAFTMRVLNTAKSLGEFKDIEIRCIVKQGTLKPNGYNLNSGGAGAHGHGIPITIAGFKYRSLNAACRVLKVLPSLAHKRLYLGWPPDQAFGLEANLEALGPKSVTIRGKTHRSITRAAEALKLSPASVIFRMRNGWAVDEAFEVVEKEVANRPKPIVVEGVTYPHARAAAEAYGLKPGMVKQRLGTYGWTVAQAFGLATKPLKNVPGAKPVVIPGEKYASLSAAAAAHRIPLTTVHNRLKRGMTMTSALKIRVGPTTRPKKAA